MRFEKFTERCNGLIFRVAKAFYLAKLSLEVIV